MRSGYVLLAFVLSHVHVYIVYIELLIVDLVLC